MQFARTRDPNLARYIIALRYVGALEGMVEQQVSASQDEAAQNARAALHRAKHSLSSHLPKE
ncbi:MAG: hypothetical protein Fur002_08230 [Anaerolineales bacterium]